MIVVTANGHAGTRIGTIINGNGETLVVAGSVALTGKARHEAAAIGKQKLQVKVTDVTAAHKVSVLVIHVPSGKGVASKRTTVGIGKVTKLVLRNATSRQENFSKHEKAFAEAWFGARRLFRRLSFASRFAFAELTTLVVR